MKRPILTEYTYIVSRVYFFKWTERVKIINKIIINMLQKMNDKRNCN